MTNEDKEYIESKKSKEQNENKRYIDSNEQNENKEDMNNNEQNKNKEAIVRREATLKRKTKETDIDLELNIDGNGESDINTGIRFLDHMLDTFSNQGLFDLKLSCKGDIDVDSHHSIEDIAIALGQAFKQAINDKKGIVRFGQAIIPMDESLCLCAIDISGRPLLVFDAEFKRQDINGFATECVYDFFYSFAMNSGITIQIKLMQGLNDHHKIEAIFKSFARSLRQACEIDSRINDKIPSTKGVL
jgi:imidazoleglycerol-phosphate dehydratase